MNKSKKILALGLMAISVISVAASSAFAAPSYGFNQNKSQVISGKKGYTTGTMRKDNNGWERLGQYRVTFQGSYAGGVRINVRTQIRDGHRKSGDMLTYEGTRNFGYNNERKGRPVHLYYTRQNSWDGNATAWGTWSSDRT